VSAAGLGAYRDSEARGLGGAFSVEKGLSDMRAEMGDRLGELRELLLDLAHRQSLAEKWRERGDLVALYRRLLDTGLAPAHAREFVEAAAESAAAWGGDLLDQLRKTVKPFLRTLPAGREGPRVLAFIGPTGGGKTASLMKAATLFRQRGRRCAIISLDTLKLGAAEELLQFARIMGLGLKLCQSRGEFAEARELFEGADRILVDTATRDFFPGPSGKDLPGALAESGAGNLLVLPATHKSQDLAAAHRAAAGPFLFGTVLTKLDETVSLGGVVNFARSMGPVFAYFSKGYKSPGDFAPADPDALIDLWLGTGPPLGARADAPAPDPTGREAPG
jgi:flagellar biosynthesis protein FlhF